MIRPDLSSISRRISPLSLARTQALLVTFLWSTSWVLIKWGLQEIPPLTFAGLRYSLAFVFLIPVLFFNRKTQTINKISIGDLLELALYGLVLYTLTQGAQFISLKYLPAITTSLVLSFTTFVVAILGSLLLNEKLRRLQWIGMLVYLAAVLLYFYPVQFPRQQGLGLVVALVGMLANAAGVLLGRRINRRQQLSAIEITVVSMGVGALFLDCIALMQNGIPQLDWQQWLIIFWLALINSAFAFVLWNHSQRILPASESSLINNTMLFQIAILAWLFLGETMNLRQIFALFMAIIAILLVQKRLPVRK